MKTVDKTNKKVIIEVTSSEIKEKGFDAIWDEIREIYPEHTYLVDNTEEVNEGKIILVTLIKKKERTTLN